MNKQIETRIRNDLRPLSNDELIEMILFLINSSTLVGKYSLPDGYDMPKLVHCIRIKTLNDAIDKLLYESDKLLGELSQLQKSPHSTSMASASILSRLDFNRKKYERMMAKLEALEAQQV